MTEGAQIAVVVLIAVLVGAAIPVLYQLQKLLRSARTVLTNLDQRLELALSQVMDAVGRVDRVVARVEQDRERLEPLIDAGADIGRKTLQIESTLRPLVTLGGAVGPAMLAAVRAIFAPPARGGRSRAEAALIPGDEGRSDSEKGIPAGPEAAVPYGPRGLQPHPARFQPKEVAHHHE